MTDIQKPQSEASELEAYFGLPQEVHWCTRCVINNQRPSTTVELKNTNTKKTVRFDENGSCEACNYHDEKYNVIDWEERERELVKLLDRHRSKDGAYDVIVPGSGGKDSIMVAHVLKHKYGMHPLTVTWPPTMYTDIGVRNFDAWLDSGFENITYHPNRDVHRRLTREAFINLGHPFQPFIFGQKQVAPKTALKYGIKLIMYGECGGENGSGVEATRIPTMYPEYYSAPRSETYNIQIAGRSYKELLEMGFTRTDLINYLPAPREDLDENKVEVHYWSFYKLWVPQDNFYYASEHTDFKPNPVRSEGTFSKYSSMDDKIDGLHWYMTFIKFGMGRCSYEASQEVRNQHTTRDEAVALMRKYDGEFPKLYFQDFLEYMQINEETFWTTVDRYRSPHLWRKDGNEWTLRHPVE